MSEPESTRLLRDLVRLPSVNPMGRDLGTEHTLEHRVTAYLEDYFRSLGVPSERQAVAPQRDNIVARYSSPGARRTIVFEAHQDTVPTDGMTIEPFEGKMEGGKLYGRGSCDIKGGMAAMLTAFARVVREKPASAANVIMACTVDEEYKATGVLRLARDLKADVAIVAEPTQLQIVNAHKGPARWYVKTTGRSCHSSSPERGINAIYRMARLLQSIELFADHLRTTRIDPYLGPATLSVGRIGGGTSVNTVPEHCWIEVDRRVLPSEDPAAVVEEFTEFLRLQGGIDFPFECELPWTIKHGLSPEHSAELVVGLGHAIDAVRGSHRVMGVPYGTDASTIAAAGVPSVVFGPGDIARAHTADEWVPLDEVEQAADILFRFVCAG